MYGREVEGAVFEKIKLTEALMPVSADNFKLGMRHLAGAVCVVTTQHGGKKRGLTVTAICSLSVDPPSVLVCVNRLASAHDAIARSRCLAVNLLSTKHLERAQIFSGMRGIEGDIRFAEEDWFILQTGAPALRSAVGIFDCQVVEAVPTKTHTVFVAVVVDAQFDNSQEPLLYLRGKYSKAVALPES